MPPPNPPAARHLLNKAATNLTHAARRKGGDKTFRRTCLRLCGAAGGSLACMFFAHRGNDWREATCGPLQHKAILGVMCTAGPSRSAWTNHALALGAKGDWLETAAAATRP